MRGLLLNVALATGWTLLSAPGGLADFALGWIIGFAFIALGRRVLRGESYVRRSLALVRFAFAFIRDFFLATFGVLRVVLTQPRSEMHPDFVDYDIRGLRPHEVVLLGFLATLTPGTAAVRIQDERGVLVLHALDARQPDEVRRWIDDHLRAGMLKFTR